MAPPGGATSKRQAWLYGTQCHQTDNLMNKTCGVQTSANRWQKIGKSIPIIRKKNENRKRPSPTNTIGQCVFLLSIIPPSAKRTAFLHRSNLRRTISWGKGTNYEQTLLFPHKYERRREETRTLTAHGQGDISGQDCHSFPVDRQEVDVLEHGSQVEFCRFLQKNERNPVLEAKCHRFSATRTLENSKKKIKKKSEKKRPEGFTCRAWMAAGWNRTLSPLDVLLCATSRTTRSNAFNGITNSFLFERWRRFRSATRLDSFFLRRGAFLPCGWPRTPPPWLGSGRFAVFDRL